jgi:hypothetical protein
MASSSQPHGHHHDQLQLLDKVNQTCLLFNQLFYQVAPTKKYNQSIQNPTIEISQHKLSSLQLDAINQLSGCLQSLQKEIENRYLSHIHANSILADMPLGVSESNDSPSMSILHLEQKKLHLLQEYLTNELVRNEELEKQVYTLEADILKATEEKVELRKKLNKQMEGRSSSSSYTKTQPNVSNETTSTNPELLIGGFIRKAFGDLHFFGLIANYTEPYFQVGDRSNMLSFMSTTELLIMYTLDCVRGF